MLCVKYIGENWTQNGLLRKKKQNSCMIFSSEEANYI